MGGLDWLLVLGVAAWIAAVFFLQRRRKKAGKRCCGCSGCCAGCNHARKETDSGCREHGSRPPE